MVSIISVVSMREIIANRNRRQDPSPSTVPGVSLAPQFSPDVDTMLKHVTDQTQNPTARSESRPPGWRIVLPTDKDDPQVSRLIEYEPRLGSFTGVHAQSDSGQDRTVIVPGIFYLADGFYQICDSYRGRSFVRVDVSGSHQTSRCLASTNLSGQRQP
jgi:hypothetical protein